jgi:hypothetical protein
MTADSDFIDLVNGALLAADEAPIGWFDLSNYFRTSNSEFPVNTINDVRARLAQLGYGKTFTDPEPPYGRHFQINQNGRIRAAELRRASAESKRFFLNIDWAKWGTITAIIGLPLSVFLAWFFS